MGGNDDEAGSSRPKRSRQFETVKEVLLPQVHHECLLWEGCDGEIDDMLRIKLCEAGSNEEIFTSVAWIIAFNISEPIYAELCHEFFSTYEFDEDYIMLMSLRRKDLMCTFREESHFYYQEHSFEGDSQDDYLWLVSKDDWIARKTRVLTDDVIRSKSALIYCRDLDTTTLRELIESEGRLILEDPQPSVPRVGIPRPPRASMQDLYDRMGSMEIR
nr:hypothetical protein [Tanacetum cinerariifolium]